MAVYNSVTELIGKTPLVRLNKYNKKRGLGATVLAKVEFFNPDSSVNNSIAMAMIEDAESKGAVKHGGSKIETKRGNTG